LLRLENTQMAAARPSRRTEYPFIAFFPGFLGHTIAKIDKDGLFDKSLGLGRPRHSLRKMGLCQPSTATAKIVDTGALFPSVAFNFPFSASVYQLGAGLCLLSTPLCLR
jgi:hypothetical protein